MTSERRRLAATASRGALVGLFATVPMSMIMAASEGAGIMTGQPPRRIVGRMLPGVSDSTADLVTVMSHALYGAAAGAACSVFPLPCRIERTIGAGFGLALWAAGYEGWVPLLGVLPPGHRDQRGRVATMIAAHLAFGAVLGRFARR